jgi:serine/threonine-protein kinase
MASLPDLFQTLPETVGEGRYRLQNRIGMGGVAEVYRAIDEHRQADCAVKMMEVPLGPRRAVGVRFLGEAKVMSKLKHPNIPRVFDAGKQGGYYWFAMELADESVAQQVRRDGVFAPGDALRVTFEVLQALGAAHGAGLVHRDVKPENVLVARDGRALLADFGIARHPEGTVPVETRPGELLGTRGYRAPEQEDDAHSALETADLYGVAATLYTMVVGEKPSRLWEEDGSSAVPVGVDGHVAAVIRRATALDPADRYPDARSMAAAVASAVDALLADAGEPLVGAAWMKRFDTLLGRTITEREGVARYLPGWARRVVRSILPGDDE